MYLTFSDYTIVEILKDEAPLATFEQKIANEEATPFDMLATAGAKLQLPTSVTFGGPDLRTVYVGSLGMSTLPTFRSPVAGLPMRHWR